MFKRLQAAVWAGILITTGCTTTANPSESATASPSAAATQSESATASPSTTATQSTTANPNTNTLTPVSSRAFFHSIGINIHLSYPIYANNWQAVRAQLVTLGVGHVRDGMLPVSNTAYYAKLRDLTTLGIHGTLTTAPSESIAYVEAGVSAAPGFAEGVEGPNEYDVNNGANWRDTLVSYQSTLYKGAKASQVLKDLPIIGPSLTRAESYAAVGDISASLDYGNMHNYFAGFSPGTHGWGGSGFGSNYGAIAYNLGAAAQSSGTKPIISTETGYCTLANTKNAIPPAIHARYIPRMFLEQYLHGVVRTIDYELIDEGAPGCDSHNGLLSADLTPKTGFVALTGLISQLDRSIEPKTLTPLGLTIAPDSTVHHLLLENGNGSYTLALWNEVSSYDVNAGTSGAIIATSPVQTTLTLTQNPATSSSSVINDQGNLTTTPLNWQNGVGIVPIDDHVTLVRISP